MEPDNGTEQPSRENPMLNPVILRTLFEVCDPQEDLPLFRLVCNLWQEESLDPWRSKATVVVVVPVDPITPAPATKQSHLQFQSGDKLISGGNVNRNAGGTSKEETILEQIIRSAADTGNTDGLRLASKPFSSFKLKGGLLSPPPGELDDEDPASQPPSDFLVKRKPSEVQHEFWRVVGPRIKRLHLHGCYCDDDASLKVLLFKFTPSLMELTIECCCLEPVFNSDDFQNIDPGAFQAQSNLSTLRIRHSTWPIAWRDTFTGFPNLKTLELHGYGRYFSSYNLIKMLEAVATLRNEGCQIALKNLDLDMDIFLNPDNNNARGISQDIANLFRDAQLPLESLKIELGRDTEDSVVRQILGQFSATLRTLHCTRTLLSARFPTNPDPDWMPFPEFLGDTTTTTIFEHLKELKLDGLVAPNFGFSEHTPNLEVLHIDYDNDRQDELEEWNWRSWMRTHVIRQVPNRIQPTSGSRMEKLKEFKTELLFDDHEAYFNFGKWMPNLTRLTAPLTEVTFPVACAAWQSTLKELHITKEGRVGDEITGVVDFGPEGEFSHGPAPNITDLKELEKYSQDKGNRYFTDHAVLYGFSCLPKLKTLEICLSEELSADALAVLNNMNVNFSWTKM